MKYVRIETNIEDYVCIYDQNDQGHNDKPYLIMKIAFRDLQLKVFPKEPFKFDETPDSILVIGKTENVLFSNGYFSGYLNAQVYQAKKLNFDNKPFSDVVLHVLM